MTSTAAHTPAQSTRTRRVDDATARRELQALEPLFHHEALGSGREVFASLIVDDYWEIGASGSRYDRDFVLDTLVERHRAPHDDPWTILDFTVRALGAETWLATYTLRQGDRVTRRSTVWQHTDRWRAVYHQGTLA